MKRTLGMTVTLLALLSVSGCVTSRIDQLRNTESAIAAGEGIAILANRQRIENETEGKFTACISDALEGTFPVVREQQFVDLMFPWFEPRLAPARPDALSTLFERPGVTERLAETGVRFLVWIDGDTEVLDAGGSISCTVSPGGAGCFGFQWWDRDSSYEATIWDLQNLEEAGTISAEVRGTSYMPAVVLPIPIVARTRDTACKQLANQIENFFGGG